MRPGEELSGLLLHEIAEDNRAEDTDRLLNATPEQLAGATTVLFDKILNHISDFDDRPDKFIGACERASARLARDGRAVAGDRAKPGIVDFIALIRLNVTLLDRRFTSPDREHLRTADQYCARLFESPGTAAAIRLVYAPDADPDRRTPVTALEKKTWRKLDFRSLRYLRAGTTSFILKGKTRDDVDESGGRDEVVLKCVLFPWNELNVISEATDKYADDYGAKNTSEVVIQPRASSDRWVVMPYQPGPTLAEHIRGFEGWQRSDGAASGEERTGPVPSVGDRVREARRLGVLLCDALDRLARGPSGDVAPTSGEPEPRQAVDIADPARQHLDLSPSNIILPRRDIVRFIDLGPNHLYTRQVGLAEHDDAVYISPEVKNKTRSTTSDAYSLAIILIQVLVEYAPRDGRVPDAVYDLSPSLGRFFDDLLEEDQAKRLLIMGGVKEFSFGALRDLLEFTFDSALKESETSRSALRRWVSRLAPASREVRVQIGQFRYAREQVRRTTTPGPGAGAGAAKAAPYLRTSAYLLGFSVVATAAWWFIFAKTALVQFEDVATFSRSPLPRGELRAASIIAWSQGLIGAKYYQTILARLTVREIPGALARVTEWLIRLMSVVALPTLFISVFWKPSLWAWGCGVGAVVVTIANLSMLILVRRLLGAGNANNLTTVPPLGRTVARGFEQWWWSMLLYAVVIFFIAIGLQTGTLKDRDAYVFGLTLISVGIHYLSKFVAVGHSVRGGLARALAVGERLSLLQERNELADWPPRLFVGDGSLRQRIKAAFGRGRSDAAHALEPQAG